MTTQANKLTVKKAARELAKIGYTLNGQAVGKDLAVFAVCYSVSHNGQTTVMTMKEIASLIAA